MLADFLMCRMGQAKTDVSLGSGMSKFGETLFSGSRFIFWSLALFLILFAVVMPLLTPEWTVARVTSIIALELIAWLLVLGLWNPKRFGWALRCVTAGVFCLYLAFLIDEAWVKGLTLINSLGARIGFISIGLPCLTYTLLGRFSFSRERAEKFKRPQISQC